MKQLTYEIISGQMPITASIYPHESDDQIINSTGIYSFDNLPIVPYKLTITDSNNCTLILDAITNICGYSMTISNDGILHTGGTDTLISGDDNYGIINLPFNFKYYNSTYSSIYAQTNGYLSFIDPNGSEYSNVNLPYDNGSIIATLFPLWTDMYVNSANGHYIYSIEEGESPNKIFIIKYRCSTYDDRNTPANAFEFEVRLYETSNNIEFVYGNNIELAGTQYTIGIQNNDTYMYQQYSGGTISTGTLIRYIIDDCNNIPVPYVTTPPTAYNYARTVSRTLGGTCSVNLEVVVHSIFNYYDAEGDALNAVKILSLPTYGTLTTNSVPVNVNDILLESDILTYTSSSDQVFAYSDTVDYQVRTNYNDNFSNTATLTYNVTACRACERPSGLTNISLMYYVSPYLVPGDFNAGNGPAFQLSFHTIEECIDYLKYTPIRSSTGDAYYFIQSLEVGQPIYKGYDTSCNKYDILNSAINLYGNNLIRIENGYITEVVSDIYNIAYTKPTRTLTVINGSGSTTCVSGDVINIIANEPNTGYIFYNWTGDVSNVSNIYNSSTTISIVASNATVTANYILLDIGVSYQGGKIAYIFNSGDTGYVQGQISGLIVDTNYYSATWRNGTSDTTQTYATGTSLGTGKSNTNTIVSVKGAGTYAARVAYDSTVGGYSDWYLPSKDELNILYLNKTILGINGSFYWSSTENDQYSAYYHNFSTNVIGTTGNGNPFSILPIRNFSNI